MKEVQLIKRHVKLERVCAISQDHRAKWRPLRFINRGNSDTAPPGSRGYFDVCVYISRGGRDKVINSPQLLLLA